MTATTEQSAWFTYNRFGMFIHWGVYALGARHEWLMNRERMSAEQYERYARHFDPDLFDAREWAAAAKAAGMKYVVLTTKHHDGFCLWDSDLTDYKVTTSPFGRDVVAEFVEAVRDAGLKVGFYHSLLDWHHPDFTIDGFHPQRDDPNAAAVNEERDLARYRDYLHGQVRELLTRYGRVDYLFFDFSYAVNHEPVVWGAKGAEDWASEQLLTMVRELQPGILVNDRLGIPGDLVTPEQYQPDSPLEVGGKPVLWEACQTLNGSWGYDRDNTDYKDVGMLVRMLIDGVAKGGNLLLNVGPNGRGAFDEHALESLDGIGEWMRLHSRSIYGAGRSSFTPPTDIRYTQRGDRLYAHLFAWPFETLHLPGLAEHVEYAQLLNDASELGMRVIDPNATAQNMSQGGQPAGTLTLTLPVRRPDVAVPVVELYLR
ncbi:alpha-L-fucosidase [Humibacter sp. RRB41]|uniref:alpha-L-fucosidase n=1 Tax=Humibacter sp. RRB41 TaxID=2919946 RepID=UPI001FAA161C|nr:alpha-L-fucosidase [Humibacter sp. RRB41]